MDLHELIQLWRWRFLLTTVVFTIFLTSFVLLAKYEQSARKTAADLAKLGDKLPLVRVATMEKKQALTGYREFLNPGYESKTVEALLYERVDDLKSLFPASQFTISAPLVLPEAASLPFSIKFPSDSYSVFINKLATMQARTFPFVTIRSIAIGYDQPAKGIVGYKVDGIITTPANVKRNGAT